MLIRWRRNCCCKSKSSEQRCMLSVLLQRETVQEAAEEYNMRMYQWKFNWCGNNPKFSYRSKTQAAQEEKVALFLLMIALRFWKMSSVRIIKGTSWSLVASNNQAKVMLWKVLLTHHQTCTLRRPRAEPVLDDLVNRGLVTAVSTEGSDNEIYNFQRIFPSYISFVDCKAILEPWNIMTNACLASNVPDWYGSVIGRSWFR